MIQKAYIEIAVDMEEKSGKGVEFRIIHKENIEDTDVITLNNFPALLIAHQIISDLQDRFGEWEQPELFD